MDTQTKAFRKCENCGCPLFSGTDTLCQRCMSAKGIQKPENMPDRSPLMAKPDTRYAIREERAEYDGVADPDLPVYQGRRNQRGYSSPGRNAAYNPSDAAYRTWTRGAAGWAIVCALLAAVLIWKKHFLLTVIIIAVTGTVLGFCTPNRYMQEEFSPDDFLTHRLSRAGILLLAGGLPALVAGWLLSLLMKVIF